MTLITRKIQYLWEIVGLYFNLASTFIKDFLFFIPIEIKKLLREHLFPPTYLHFKSCSIVLVHDQKSFQLSKTIALIIAIVAALKVKYSY